MLQFRELRMVMELRSALSKARCIVSYLARLRRRSVLIIKEKIHIYIFIYSRVVTL